LFSGMAKLSKPCIIVSVRQGERHTGMLTASLAPRLAGRRLRRARVELNGTTAGGGSLSRGAWCRRACGLYAGRVSVRLEPTSAARQDAEGNCYG
jgi:hypothetical protein